MPEHHATPSELLWTLQLKRFRLQLEHYVFCDISLVLSDRKFESNVQLVGVVFGSLLCTTDLESDRRIFHCSQLPTLIELHLLQGRGEDR